MISQLASRMMGMIPKSNFSSSKSVTYKLPVVETYRLDSKLFPTEVTTTKEELLHVYREFQIMRRMQIECDRLYKLRHIRGFLHLYDGQEAVITGIQAALNKQDCMITAYRDHCHAYLRGNTVHQIIAEMCGKRTGSTKGKGGSMHYYNQKSNFYGGHGIVGAQFPMGTGLAFALKYQNKPNVAICMYGDGASNQGQFFESANMAYLWKLPVIYICQNNLYSMGTPLERHAMNTKLYARLDQVPGFVFDAQNYLHVQAFMQFSQKYSLENGPLAIQMLTYRYHGHSMSDPGISYRTKDQVQNVRDTRDCIKQIEIMITENNFATLEQLQEINEEAKQIVQEASDRALSDQFPDTSDLTKDIYVDNEKHFMRGIQFKDSYFPEGKPY